MRKPVAVVAGLVVLGVIVASIADSLLTPSLSCPRCGQPLRPQARHGFLYADAQDYRCSGCNRPFRVIHWQDGNTQFGELGE